MKNIKLQEKKYVKSPKKIFDIKVVNDIQQAVEELENGNLIARFEYGDSMSPILSNGEYCIVEPIVDVEDVEEFDAVLCNVNGILMTHIVVQILISENNKERYFLIGDSHKNIYGLTKEIYGIAHGTNIIEMPLGMENIEEIKEENVKI